MFASLEIKCPFVDGVHKFFDKQFFIMRHFLFTQIIVSFISKVIIVSFISKIIFHYAERELIDFRLEIAFR